MTNTKFVLYKRLSVEDKKRTQHGFDSQQRDIDIFLERVEGAEVLGEFQEFVSGGADIKPELNKAIEVCRQQGAVLLVAKVDRLSRRTSQVTAYLEGDVKFKVACMPNADNFQITIYAALAEQERAFIRDRVKKGLAAAKAKGVLMGASNPKHKASYQANKHNHKKTREREATTLKLKPVVDNINSQIKYSSDGLTLKQIACNLNSEGYTTSKGKEFSEASVSRLIRQSGISYKRKHKHL